MGSAPQIDPSHHWTVPLSAKDGWIKSSSIYADVHASTSDEKVAHHLSQHAVSAIPRLAQQLGVPAGGPMQIYVADSELSFEEMQPSVPPDWADGTAWPGYGWIFLRSPSIRSGLAEPLTQVLEHEIVHVLLGRAFGLRPVPRWLQEGTAQVFSGEYNVQTLNTLGSFTDPIPLSELTRGFPANQMKARIAYAQSADLVAYILSTYGMEAVQTLIRETLNGKGFEDAFIAATGNSTSRMEQRWVVHRADAPLWMQNAFGDTTLIAIAGLLLVVAFFRKRSKTMPTGNWMEEARVHQMLVDEIATWALQPQWNLHQPPFPGTIYGGYR